MRELDTLLEAFADRFLADLGAEERARLRAILELPDPELHAYLIGGVPHPDPELADFLRRIRESIHPEA